MSVQERKRAIELCLKAAADMGGVEPAPAGEAIEQLWALVVELENALWQAQDLLAEIHDLAGRGAGRDAA